MTGPKCGFQVLDLIGVYTVGAHVAMQSWTRDFRGLLLSLLPPTRLLKQTAPLLLMRLHTRHQTGFPGLTQGLPSGVPGVKNITQITPGISAQFKHRDGIPEAFSRPN